MPKLHPGQKRVVSIPTAEQAMQGRVVSTPTAEQAMQGRVVSTLTADQANARKGGGGERIG